MTPKEVKILQDQCADAEGANRYALREVFASLRRRVAAGEDVSDANCANVAAITRYEQECDRLSVWDFETVVFKTVNLLRDFPEVASVVRAKYPVVLVDEYQDLGAALHRLVQLLVDSGVSVTAVGDADQSIFGFAGGDPQYLEALSRREDFESVPLSTNYRCGSAVIAAAQVALAETRGWQADPRRSDPGTIEIRISSGDARTQAKQASAAVQEFLMAGIVPNEIAILLRFRKPLAPLIDEELKAVGVNVQLEGTSTSPNSALGKWLASCALYATELVPTPGRPASTPRTKGAEQLLDQLDQFRSQAGYARSTAPALMQIHALHAALTATAPGGVVLDVPSWSARVTEVLNIGPLSGLLGDSRNQDDLESLLNAPAGQSLEEIANDLSFTGRVTVGTYHGAKGRTFTAVLLPALTEGVVPPWGRNYKRAVPPTDVKVREERRSFYVALTRSRGSVLLHTTKSGVDNWGERTDRGYSRFATELARKLNVALP